MTDDLHELFSSLEKIQWRGVVYRHMFNRIPPHRENVKGARWNPPNIAAIYTSLKREGALAEAEYGMSLQPVRPSVSRHIYKINIEVDNLVDVSDAFILKRFGLEQEDLTSPDFSACQKLGQIANWDGAGGLIIPSARSDALNLVIYPECNRIDALFEVEDVETL